MCVCVNSLFERACTEKAISMIKEKKKGKKEQIDTELKWDKFHYCSSKVACRCGGSGGDGDDGGVYI